MPVLLFLSIVLATLLYEQLPGWRFFRTVLFLPYILAIPVVGIVASFMFQLHGPINQVLQALGLDRLAIDWLGQERYALITVGIVIVAREVGFGIVLFLARLMSLDASLLEAARIDGAGVVPATALRDPAGDPRGRSSSTSSSPRSRCWPGSSRTSTRSRRAGPGTATITMELYIYNVGEVQSTPGMASAAAAVLLVGTTFLIALLFIARWRASRAEAAGG